MRRSVPAALLAVCSSLAVSAAEAPRVHALTNVRIVTAPGKVIEKGTVVVRGGLIEAVGAQVAVPADAEVRDLGGRTVYPGLVDPYVTLSRLAGKKETPPEDDDGPDGARRRRTAAASATPVAASGNAHPLGNRVRPEWRALADLAVNAEVKETLRGLGFTVVAAVPDHGVFRGRSGVVSLADGPIARNVVMSRWAQHVAPDLEAKDGEERYPASLMGWAAVTRQTFLDARWLRDAEALHAASPAGRPRPERVEAWAALGDAVAGKEPVVFEAPGVLQLLRSAALAKEMGVKPVYVGAGDAYRLLDEVKAIRPDLILTLAFPAAPAVDDEDEWLDVPLERLRHWDRAASNPRWLRDAGLPFALTTHALPELTDLADRVKKARARGLSADDVLAGFTTVPARLLGLSDKLGEIAPGRLANLVVTQGSLFAEKGRVVETWVDGVRYEAKPKKGALAGKYRIEGGLLEIKSDPKTGLFTASVTPADGKAMPATSVSRHGTELRFEIDGAALGLGVGSVPAAAFIEGDSARLEVRRGAERVVRRGEREEKKEKEGEPEKDLPDSDVRPAPPRFAGPLASPKAVVVRNATVWTSGPQGVLLGADVLLVDGKVAAVGKALAAPPGAVEVDGTGKHVTPGLVDCHSHTALEGNVNEGTHNVTAEVRAGDILDPFDVAIYRELAGGLTTAHALHGSANAIGGQDEVWKLRFGAGPDGLRLAGATPGIKFALGENPKGSNRPAPGTRYPQTRMGVSALIRERFLAARDYRRRQKEYETTKRGLPVKPDLQLEAIAEILEGKRLIHSHGYVKQELLDLIRTCEEFGVRIGTLQHVLEGYKIADEIAAHGAGASSFADWWAYKFEVYDAIPQSPDLMRQRGVLVSINSDSDDLARRLNAEAAKSVKWAGTPKEEALKMVTWNAAKQLRLEKRIGSLEPGKDGDLAVWSGEPLSPSAVCLETWVDGKKQFDRAADLAGRQALAAEKAALVAAARAAGAKGEARGPGGERAKPPAAHRCEESDETGTDAEVTR